MIQKDRYIPVSDLHQAYQDYIAPQPCNASEIEKVMFKLGFRKSIRDRRFPTRYVGIAFTNLEIITNQPPPLD